MSRFKKQRRAEVVKAPLTAEDRKAVAEIRAKVVKEFQRAVKDTSNRPRRMVVKDWLKDHETLLALVEPIADRLPQDVIDYVEQIANRVDDVSQNHEYGKSVVHWFPMQEYIRELTFLLLVIEGKGSHYLADVRADAEAQSREKTLAQLSMELLAKVA